MHILIYRACRESKTATETDQRDKQSSKSVQTGADTKVTEEDLTSDAGPSENYWKIVAERRRYAHFFL